MLSLSSLIATEFYKQQSTNCPAFVKGSVVQTILLLFVWQLHKRPLNILTHNKKTVFKTVNDFSFLTFKVTPPN